MVLVAPTHGRCFASYDCDDDRTLAKNLLDRLPLNFRASIGFDYDIWDETAIMVGEHRATAIAEGLQKTDFGLFLVSMAWLAKFKPDGSLTETLPKRHRDGACRTRLLGIAGKHRRFAVLAQIPTFHDFARQGVSDHALPPFWRNRSIGPDRCRSRYHLLAHEHDVLGAHVT